MKYLVTKWLFKNHFHHRSASDPPLGSPSDFNDMYDILVDKGIEFYDANWFTKSFQIRLGKPKMRARRVLTLPPYSMQLCLHESGVVRLFPDLDDYPEVTHVRRALGGWPKYARLQFSTHPHVTHDGNPCLGDFSNPWATCLRNNDLLMFLHVLSLVLLTGEKLIIFGREVTHIGILTEFTVTGNRQVNEEAYPLQIGITIEYRLKLSLMNRTHVIIGLLTDLLGHGVHSSIMAPLIRWRH